MNNNRRALEILCGAVAAWIGAVIGKWLITEPAFLWGMDLRMFLPNPSSILWLIGGQSSNGGNSSNGQKLYAKRQKHQ